MELADKNLTPMLRQYHKIKKEVGDAILFFRLGDFYETFYEDAKIASRVLDIVLTSRGKGTGIRYPMAGIPYHAADSYIARLVKAGYKVAICEQVEDPKKAKGIVKREIVQIVTPGTTFNENVIDSKQNSYILSLLGIIKGETIDEFGMAFCDVTTGDFYYTYYEHKIKDEDIASFLEDEIMRLQPKEILINEAFFERNKDYFSQVAKEYKTVFTVKDDWEFDFLQNEQVLKEHFKVSTLAGFGLENKRAVIGSAGVLLMYLQETQKRQVSHIKTIQRYNPDEYMILDSDAIRNLELLYTMRDGSVYGSLLWVLDETLTPMGGRLLKRFILFPLKDVEKVRSRHQAVELFFNDAILLEEVRDILRNIKDVERLITRVVLKNVRPTDLLTLKESLLAIEALLNIEDKFTGGVLKESFSVFKKIYENLKKVATTIAAAIVDDPPATVREGKIIKPGYDAALDELKDSIRDAKDWISSLQSRERERTGIPSLKVGFNKVFGYYIEVTKTHLHLIPQDYIRKQTLVNAERFITPELKEKEEQVLSATERINELEYEIFQRILDFISEYQEDIKAYAQEIAKIDVFSTFAVVAQKNNYVKPLVYEGFDLYIKDGRHPVIEKIQEERFNPNDAELTEDRFLAIITGPNMAGKSTYIRQVALIALLAQIGSFVPAAEAKIGIIDRIFTRVGASDNLVRGLSTFMVEMIETANILNNATRKSLIILDELGRGTSTYDGLSIAWAVIEYIAEKIGAKTLFATHYHEVTQLENVYPQIKNLNVAVKEWNNRIIFLHSIVEGAADKSYGIEVAKLAGLPSSIIQRAREILEKLESESIGAAGLPVLTKEDIIETQPIQLTLFEALPDELVQRLKKTDINSITPLQAHILLSEVISSLQKEGENGKD